MGGFHRIASCECLKRRRKVGRPRHRCAVDQHRDHPDVPLERRFNLHPNVVCWVVEPRVSVIVPGVEPARPNHRDERDARGDMLIERFHEVDAWLDGVDVHEQLLAVEMLQQSVVEAACRRLVVAAPVIDKDATGHNILGVCSMALHVAREISMEASACSSVRTATIPRCPPIFAYSEGERKKLTASKWLLRSSARSCCGPMREH